MSPLDILNADQRYPKTILALFGLGKTISFCFQMGNEIRMGPPARTHPGAPWGGQTQRRHLSRWTSCPTDKGKCGLPGNYGSFSLEVTNLSSSGLWLRGIHVFGNVARDRTFVGSVQHLPAAQPAGTDHKQYFNIL